MRISDWSSDVCSSDLGAGTGVQSERPPSGNLAAYTALLQGRQYSRAATDEAGHRKALDAYTEATRLDPGYALAYANQTIAWINISSLHRSEEHTSELQSLMRISSAVFCLKKKKHRTNHYH